MPIPHVGHARIEGLDVLPEGRRGVCATKIDEEGGRDDETFDGGERMSAIYVSLKAVAAGPEAKASPEPARYHAFDRVRALAMLLGVVYHALLFPMLMGGWGPAASGPSSTPKLLGDWMHSFRMPLFFLIAGFFGRMMLAKYGTAGFLRRRWERIALPLMIGLVTFSPLNTLILDQVKRPPTSVAGAHGPSRPAGTVSRSTADPQGGRSATPGLDRPGASPPGGEIAGRIFGPLARLFPLYHLWFLWYLLVFVTVAPFLAGGLARVAPSTTDDSGDRPGLRLVRLGLAPVLLGAAATPALLATQNPSDWFLGPAPAIYQTFPDFLIHFDVDQLFYFVYFAAGWWLHRQRAALPSLAEGWLTNAVVGLAAYGVAVGLQARYGGPSSAGDPGIVRPVAVAVYCLGSACTCFAFLGVFLRFLDSPSRAWRFLADSALWVYLVHPPLVFLGLAACRSLGLPWWASTAAVSASSIAVALLLYKGLVRRSFLAGVFGPSAARPAVAS
jgi:peptidoglycan/LPS O-acetylase OafA/YrhL